MSNEINFTINVCVDADDLKKEVEEYLADAWNGNTDPESVRKYALKCAKWEAEKAFQEAIKEKMKELIKKDEMTNLTMSHFKKALSEMSVPEMITGMNSYCLDKYIERYGTSPYAEFMKFTEEQKEVIKNAVFDKVVNAIQNWDSYSIESLLRDVLGAVLGRKVEL